MIGVTNPLFHDGAPYRPAMQPWYSEFLSSKFDISRTQGRLSLGDLDLLSGAGLVTSSHFLQGAPNGLGRRRLCMVEARNALVCDGVADSGGYQVSTGNLVLTESVRHQLLRYSETFAAACILDAPTSSIGRPGTGLFSFRDCLEFTLESARYAMRHRIPGRTRLLNVTQGRSRSEVRTWLDAVKPLNDTSVNGGSALDDWAFAGATRLYGSVTLSTLIELRDENLIKPGARLHVLGSGHPEVACLLTALQDGLRSTVDDGIVVSSDGATPFLLAGRFKKAFGSFSVTRRRLQMKVIPMPEGLEFVGSDDPWPCSSPFADRLTIGDLNAKRTGRTTWDTYSQVMLAAHNVWMLSAAIAEANKLLRLPEGAAMNKVPRDLVELTQVVREVLQSERPMTLIRRHAPLLDSLGHKSRNTSMIDDPKFTDR